MDYSVFLGIFQLVLLNNLNSIDEQK